MTLLDRIRSFTPTRQTVGFWWSMGAWLAMGLIVTNTLLAVVTVRAQLLTLALSSVGDDPRSVRRAIGDDTGLSLAERRQLLAAAKIFVLTHDVPDTNFALVFIRRVGDWALLEVVSAEESAEVVRVLMERGNKGWEGKAIGAQLADWIGKAPPELLK
jgi:hypothetical protein